MKTEETMHIDESDLSNLFGHLDRNIKIIEKMLGVDVVYRGEEVHISGDERRVHSAKNVIRELVSMSKTGTSITEQNVNYALSLSQKDLEIGRAHV